MLAQLSTAVDTTGVTTPDRMLAGLLGLLTVTAIFSGLGGLLSQRTKWDDWVRVAIGIFGIAPIILTIPIFGILGQLVRLGSAALVDYFFHTTTGSDVIAFLFSVALAVLGVVIYRNKRGTGRLILAAVLVSGLLGTAPARAIAGWVIPHLGVPIWNLDVFVFQFIVNFQVHVG